MAKKLSVSDLKKAADTMIVKRKADAVAFKDKVEENALVPLEGLVRPANGKTSSGRTRYYLVVGPGQLLPFSSFEELTPNTKIKGEFTQLPPSERGQAYLLDGEYQVVKD